MTYSAKEIIQYASEEDVKFIRLAFCDVYGQIKNVSIMPDELQRAFSHGIAFDASAIKGFDYNLHSDLFLHPDPSTLSLLPWRPEHGRVVRMFCNIKYPDGTPFECDTRNILSSAVKTAYEHGLSFNFGSESEFYLFNQDENGNATTVPYDNASYMDIAPADKGENVRREICLTLEKMGITPESSHHEEGPGQNEIDFKYSDALTAADNALSFRSVVKTVASRNGLVADFSPKPLPNQAGNGMHINVSVHSRDDKDYLSYLVQGILNHVSEMTAFLNPGVESYDRLGQGKAPKYITWSEQNRAQLVRIPAAKDEYVRCELRSPDSLTNPYIAYSLIIYAALEAIESKSKLVAATDVDFSKLSSKQLAQYKELPASFTDAARLAKESDFIKKYLPSQLIDSYCE